MSLLFQQGYFVVSSATILPPICTWNVPSTVDRGLYYKHVTIINDASSDINKLKASPNDVARGVIYDRHMFIIQATG